MHQNKTTFAVFFGNRGFFPASLQKAARHELKESLEKIGHKIIMLDEQATRFGAVETPKEGQVYANFLDRNKGKFGGVILSLPNFGDETGAVSALKDCDVPIFIQAYPDELDKMGPKLRRDAFCGKLSIMDVFCQYGLPFTASTPHTVHPLSKQFAANVDYFDRLCRVVNSMKRMVVGAIGARTTPFKTVRIDELTLQKHGITTETLDLSDILNRVNLLTNNDKKCKEKARVLADYSSWKGVPQDVFRKLVRLAVVLDSVVEEFELNAMAVRCWIELQQQLGVSPCVVMSEMIERGMMVSCEVDVGNAVTMFALSRASGNAASCLDWNNNYGDDANKCILFHCGSVPKSMMAGKGQICDHAILANVLGKGCAFGCNTGRIAPSPMTFGSMLTSDGDLKFYVGQGQVTNDPIPDDFFGCAGVVKIDRLQEALQKIGYLGHRHHTSITPGHVLEPVADAFERYLDYKVTRL